MSALARSCRVLGCNSRRLIPGPISRNPRIIRDQPINLRRRYYSSDTLSKHSRDDSKNNETQNGVLETDAVAGDASYPGPNASGRRRQERDIWREYGRAYEDTSDDVLEFPKGKITPDMLDPLDLYELHGQLQRVTVMSKNMIFADIKYGSMEVQVACIRNPAVAERIRSTPLGSAVKATGSLQRKLAPKKSGSPKSQKPLSPEDGIQFGEANMSSSKEHQIEKSQGNDAPVSGSQMTDAGAFNVELLAEDFECLNSFQSTNPSNPAALNVTHPPQSRHLQIRYDKQLAERLAFRSDVVKFMRTWLKDFQEVETPILFKSTSEGAREFLVPTRRKGYAYALPQSPQQYKQMLIASGVTKYFQFARCFRDEDMRADRQPEFTQLDLEIAWARGSQVRSIVENLVRSLYANFEHNPMLADKIHSPPAFPILDYVDAMRTYGSDKPDTRISGKILNVTRAVPDSLRGMLTSLESPMINAWRFRTGAYTGEVRAFVRRFLDSPEAAIFHENPDGGPGVCIFDAREPLEGLQIFGHEGARQIKLRYRNGGAGEFEDGDLLILQARPEPLTGGSTMLGKLRVALHKAAVEEGLIDPPRGHNYLWVTNFPMFTADDGTDPGQRGSSGFSATHHPFTAPNSMEDVELLKTDPLKAYADHYDLVVNGIELGGGSRRIHNVDIQKYVMRDVLKMSEERMNDFSHLFDALASGCPPHAGFAIGFDRLMAILTGRDSVKDVIAFPKSSKGEDLMVKSPSLITDGDLETYHLAIRDDGAEVGQGQAVPKAKDTGKIETVPSTP